MQTPETHRICLTLHYDGGAFYGWQLQPKERTVQGELERVLARLIDRPVRVIGSGRTDRGVHATGQVASLDAPAKWTPHALSRALNALLPGDVRVVDARVVPDAFHPRYGAVSRSYVYRVGLSELTASPFHARWCWPLRAALDREAMDAATREILGDHSFRAFAKAGQEERGDRCEVQSARWTEWEGLGVQLEISAATERPLTEAEAGAAFDEIMEGRATPVQIAALLVGIRVRGATPQEVAGGVGALRRAMVPVKVPDPGVIVDNCGTGGGALTTFNISTAAALVAAGAGVVVAKHGNRSFTSRCGSADLLESFGVRFDLTPEQEAEVLERAGIVFMFAPNHHPAMRHVGPVRKELGMPTIMNVLGPLTNPASARRQVVGVADPALLPLVAEALRVLGHERALVVHGEPGMDELSPVGPTRVVELRDGKTREYVFDPQAELGWESWETGELAGCAPEENAVLVKSVLMGETGGVARAAVVLNAAAALFVAGRVDDLPGGVRIAEGVIRDGAGWERLERLREASRRV